MQKEGITQATAVLQFFRSKETVSLCNIGYLLIKSSMIVS